MNSFLKQFKLPLDKEKETITHYQSFQHDRAHSSGNCFSQSSRRRTIQDILKISNKRPLKSVYNSINSSPQRISTCPSPKERKKLQSQNKSIQQENQTPSNKKNTYLIATDFHNKHYKIVQQNEGMDKKATISYPSDDRGGLLQNLKLKQSHIGNIQFPTNYKDSNRSGYNDYMEKEMIKIINEKQRPTSMMSNSDKKRTTYLDNSPKQTTKNKFHQTIKPSHPNIRQLSSFNDNTRLNYLQVQENNINKHLNETINSFLKFPANMPVKTRKYRLKKEDIIERTVTETRKKEYDDVKERVKSQTQYTINELNTTQNCDQSFDNSYNMKILNHNDTNDKFYTQFQENYSYILSLKANKQLSKQNSPITQKEKRQSRIMNRSALLSRESINDVCVQQSQSKDKIKLYQLQPKISQNQITLSDNINGISLQNIQDSDFTVTKSSRKVYIDIKVGQHQPKISANENTKSNYSVMNLDKQLSNTHSYYDQYPQIMKSMNSTDSIAEKVSTPCRSSQHNKNHLASKDVTPQKNQLKKNSSPFKQSLKNKYYSLYEYTSPLKNEQIQEQSRKSQQSKLQKLFGELESQQQQIQEAFQNNKSNNNQYNYFSYNQIFN